MIWPRIPLLIAMALDASKGTAEGVKSLTEQALKAGATKEEIMEAVRVAHIYAGWAAVTQLLTPLRKCLERYG